MTTPAIQQFSMDLKQVAIGCLYLLTRRAILDFPHTSSSHPSAKVYLSRSADPPLRDGDRVYFPIIADQDWWHRVVVPVLLNPDVRIYVLDRPSLRNQINTAHLEHSEFDTLIDKILYYLKLSSVEAGYAPYQVLTGEEVAPPPVSPDGINRNPLGRTSLLDTRYRLSDVP